MSSSDAPKPKNDEKAGKNPPSEGTDDSRRGALKVLCIAGGAAFGCALAAPAAFFVTAPVASLDGSKGGGTWVKTVRLASLPEGAPKKVAIVADQHDAWTIAKDVDLGAAWLVREGDSVKAWSVVCPHLGCSVNAEPDGSFGCPCHTSAFDKNGKKVSGPAPRDMDPLATKIDGEFVYVQFARFRIGTEERVQVGS